MKGINIVCVQLKQIRDQGEFTPIFFSNLAVCNLIVPRMQKKIMLVFYFTSILFFFSAGCTKCTGFISPFTCGCGAAISKHTMIVETADEREARGHPLGEATPYAAMGGLTGFSSLAEGNMRLDPSGRGKTFRNKVILIPQVTWTSSFNNHCK